MDFYVGFKLNSQEKQYFELIFRNFYSKKGCFRNHSTRHAKLTKMTNEKSLFQNHSKCFQPKFLFVKIQLKFYYSILVNFRCLCRYFLKNLIPLGKKFETNHFNFRRGGRFVSSFINTRKGHFHIFRRILFLRCFVIPMFILDLYEPKKFQK